MPTQTGTMELWLPYYLPTDLKNSRKVPFTSDPSEDPVPHSVPPFTEEMERTLVGSMMVELSEEFGLNLDPNPDLSRVVDPRHRSQHRKDSHDRCLAYETHHASAGFRRIRDFGSKLTGIDAD